jgi:hypothetical protein
MDGLRTSSTDKADLYLLTSLSSPARLPRLQCSVSASDRVPVSDGPITDSESESLSPADSDAGPQALPGPAAAARRQRVAVQVQRLFTRMMTRFEKM